jgi:chemotaxis protein MotB
MNSLAVGLIVSVVVLPGCVSSTKYRTAEDRLARTNDELASTQAMLGETEDMLVDVNGQKAALAERAAMADRLAAEKAALEKQIKDLQAKGAITAPDGTVIFTQDGMYGYRAQGDVVFSPGSDKLTKEGERILGNLANELKSNNHPIKVVGHTDTDPINKTKEKFPRGNIQLGAYRAMTVRDYFVSNGLPESRISITSYGPYRPIAPGGSPEAKAKNRRVEVMVGINEPPAGS